MAVLVGGQGAVWRSVLGVLFLALIDNGYNLLGLNPLYQQVTVGTLILVSVGVTCLGPVAQRWNLKLAARPRVPATESS